MVNAVDAPATSVAVSSWMRPTASSAQAASSADRSRTTARGSRAIQTRTSARPRPSGVVRSATRAWRAPSVPPAPLAWTMDSRRAATPCQPTARAHVCLPTSRSGQLPRASAWATASPERLTARRFASSTDSHRARRRPARATHSVRQCKVASVVLSLASRRTCARLAATSSPTAQQTSERVSAARQAPAASHIAPQATLRDHVRVWTHASGANSSLSMPSRFMRLSRLVRGTPSSRAARLTTPADLVMAAVMASRSRVSRASRSSSS